MADKFSFEAAQRPPWWPCAGACPDPIGLKRSDGFVTRTCSQIKKYAHKGILTGLLSLA